VLSNREAVLLLLLGIAASALVYVLLPAVSCWLVLSVAEGSCLLLLLLCVVTSVLMVTARRCLVMLRVLLNWAAPAQHTKGRISRL
jgi:hypothetical protein